MMLLKCLLGCKFLFLELNLYCLMLCYLPSYILGDIALHSNDFVIVLFHRPTTGGAAPAPVAEA